MEPETDKLHLMTEENFFDTDIFLSNLQTISHNPERFVLDFKCASPQFGMGQARYLFIHHKTILIDPYKAKIFNNALTENIARYEKQYGKIELPKAVIKASKDYREDTTNSEKKETMPDYLG